MYLDSSLIESRNFTGKENVHLFKMFFKNLKVLVDLEG